MNRILLIGRLTAKPELHYTSSNTPYTRFNVAVNRQFSNADGKREADFIPVQVWRKQAETICQYLDKGRMISVEGIIQTGTYQDKSGNKRPTWIVIAEHVQFLENKQTAKNIENASNNKQDAAVQDEQVDIYSEFGDEIEDNYLD